MSSYQWHDDQAVGEAAQREWESENKQLRAEVEKLRGVLWQVRDAMEATDQAPDGEDDPRRPLAAAVWRATGVRR